MTELYGVLFAELPDFFVNMFGFVFLIWLWLVVTKGGR
jgi:hypothetical protein